MSAEDIRLAEVTFAIIGQLEVAVTELNDKRQEIEGLKAKLQAVQGAVAEKSKAYAEETTVADVAASAEDGASDNG